MSTAIIYARVSSVRQADDGLPLESQLERCHEKAAALGATVLKVFRDDGISGRGTRRRSGFLAAVEYCEEHRVKFMICWSTSRFARNQIDAILNKKLLEQVGTRRVYVSQDFAENDDGWMAEAITEILDERTSRQTAKDTRRSMAKNAADGFFNGGHVPFGYRVVACGKRKRLEPNPVEVATVRLVFRWYLSGAGCKEIAGRLNQTGLAKRARRWDKANVASVLRGQAVVGRLVFREGDHEIVTQAHEAIISEEDFMTAQQLMIDRAPRKVGGAPRSEAVFSGILRCGVCGDAMTTESATGRGGVRYSYYNCRGFLKAGTCASRRLPVPELDAYLLDGILDQVFTADNLRALVKDLKESSGQWIRDREAQLAALVQEGAGIERRLRRLYETIEGDTGLNLDDVAPRLRELRARQDAIKRETNELKFAPGPDVEVTDRDVVAAAALFRDMVETCQDPKRVRGFLSGILRSAVLNKEEVRLEYFADRIVNAKSGSQWQVSWLPDLTTLRTVNISLKGRLIRAA